MEEIPPSDTHSRRSFLLKSLSPLAAMWLQGCMGLRPRSTGSAEGNKSESDHPLAAIPFHREDVLTSQMNVRMVETPVNTAEGYATWHVRGVHPYPYLVDEAAEITDWKKSRRALHVPPQGLRSGVPLGGLGTGTIELRADGSLADWQIFNNSPGNGEKVHLDDAFFAIRAQLPDGSRLALPVRTSPPDPLPAADVLAYAGAFPVSRIRLYDSRLPVSVSLYAYGPFGFQDTALSHAPAAVFSFLLSNPTNEPIRTSIMYSQPNFLEGTFRTERGLILSKSGNEPISGEICLEFDSSLSVTSLVASDLEEIWEAFDKEGKFASTSSFGLFEHGAIATDFIIEPGAERAVSLVIAWHFPNRVIADQMVGNAYTQRYRSASDASAYVTRRLPECWRSLQAWQLMTANNALPAAVHDGLKDSLAQLYKTTFCTSDGRWRSWDSFTDPDLSSMEMTLYRALPLLFIDPEMLKSLLRAFAIVQLPEGRMPDKLGRGKSHRVDAPVAPIHNRATSSFFVLSYAYLTYTGDSTFIKELWPHLAKGLDWQLSVTTPEGLPSNLPALSDWASSVREGVSLYDAMLHLTGLQSVMLLAESIDRAGVAAQLKEVIGAGVRSLPAVLGASSGYKFNAPQQAVDSGDVSARSHALLGFLWARVLGFDALLDRRRISAFLDEINDENSPAIFVDRPSKGADALDEESLLPAGAMNWAALNIYNGDPTSRSFEVLNRLFRRLQEEMSDSWGQYEKISLEDPLPLANPHHASHLAIWFSVLALSGQRFDAPNKKLGFSPRIKNGESIPFFIPEARGLLSAHRSGRFQVHVVSGRLELKELEIGENILYRDILLEEGQVLQLNP